jgi:hypothetical protein
MGFWCTRTIDLVVAALYFAKATDGGMQVPDPALDVADPVPWCSWDVPQASSPAG